MFLGDCVLVARRGDIHARLVEFLARQRALLEELLAALENFFLGVECLLGLLRVGFGLLDLFRQAGCGGGLVSGLRLIVGAPCVLRRGRQVAILEHGQQFSLVNAGCRASPETSAPER